MRWSTKDRGGRIRKLDPKAKKKPARGAIMPPSRIPAFIEGNEHVMGILKKRLERMRIVLLERPTDAKGRDLNPVLPPDLTSLNDEQLGRLYGQFCQMVQYVQLQLATQGVKRALADRAEKWVRAKTWLMKSGTVGDKEAQVEVELAVQERSLKALTEGAAESMKDQIMQSYLIGKDACSREVTRRLGTHKRELD